jgi:hypothetical protein
MTTLQALLAQYTATHWQSIDDDARAHLAGFVVMAFAPGAEPMRINPAALAQA